MPATSPSTRRSVIASSDLPSIVQLNRDTCTDLSAAESREWLVTNGLGSFASGTIAGLLTRRYHGLLIAALDPPRKRTLLATKVDEVATLSGQMFSLGANRWAGGALDPQGYGFIDSCHASRAGDQSLRQLPRFSWRHPCRRLANRRRAAHGESAFHFLLSARHRGTRHGLQRRRPILFAQRDSYVRADALLVSKLRPCRRA